MDKAKQAVNSFISHSGKHKTVVDEDVRPAVVDEHVRPHQHENISTAVDKEIHQHHHHTAVQPINTVEKLPEKHTHKTVPVQEKVVHHGDGAALRETLDRESAKFKSHSATHETTYSQATAPVVTGERIHHHVHEHVQPVIHKEVVAPEVIHTTVPIHETHHVDAVHHGISTLPPKTLEEWNQEGGVQHGREARVLGEAEGCPAPYNKELQIEQTEADRHMHQSATGHRMGVGARRGSSSSDEERHRTGKTVHSSDNYALGNRGPTTRSAAAGTTSTAPRSGAIGTTHGRETHHVDSHGVRSGSNQHAQPSLVDKLNPFKDADGDGKKGMME